MVQGSGFFWNSKVFQARSEGGNRASGPFYISDEKSEAKRSKVPCIKSHKTDNYGRRVQAFSLVTGPMKTREAYPNYLATTTKGLLELLQCLW